jgi:hypothetical protein
MQMTAKAPRGKSIKARPVFGSIRKPVAPPGHPLTRAKPDEKARPAGRKAKHKQRPADLLTLGSDD